MLRGANQRKCNQRDGIKNKNGGKRNRRFLFVGLNDRSDRGDRAAAADCGSRCNEIRSVAAHLQEFSKSQPNDQRERNSEGGVDESAAACLDDFVQIHAEAERDDAGLQQKSGEVLAIGGGGRGGAAAQKKFGGERMRDAEAKNNSDGEGDWWRDVTAGGNDQTGEKQGLDEDCFKAFADDLVLHGVCLCSTTTVAVLRCRDLQPLRASNSRCAFAFGQRCGFNRESGGEPPRSKMFASDHRMSACCDGFGFGASAAGAAGTSLGDCALCSGEAPPRPVMISAMIFVVRALLIGKLRS